jgi:TatD DNase family protein
VVDTHCHLDSCKAEPSEVVGRALAAGVTKLATVGTDRDSVATVGRLATEHDEVFKIVGLHPNNAEGFDGWVPEGEAREPKVVAVGETGLDYYRDYAPHEDQKRAFEAHIDLARELDLPLVIHTRAAEEDTFALLADRAQGLTVILHCFSAPDRLDEAIEHGYLCSFAGNVTYPKATDLQDAAERVPDELLLVETDSPYLGPQPVRGKPNEPANVTLTARFVAERRGMTYEELEAVVERNAARVFGW